MNVNHSLPVGIVVALALALSACGDDGGREPAVLPAGSETPEEAGAAPSTESSATEVEDTSGLESAADVVTTPDPTPDEEEAPSPRPAEPSSSEFLLINGEVSVPAGDPDVLGIALTGENATDRGVLPIIIRNNTDRTKYRIGVSALARDADGSLAGSGSDHGLNPNVLEPGEWAFGYVYFGSDIPDDATYDFTLDSSDDPGRFGAAVDLVPVESNSTSGTRGAQIIGVIENSTDETVGGPLGVSAACFDASGTSLLTIESSYAEADELAAGGTTSFSMNLFDDECANYAIGASGYDF